MIMSYYSVSTSEYKQNFESFKSSLEVRAPHIKDLTQPLDVGKDLGEVFMAAGFKENTKYDYPRHYNFGQEHGLCEPSGKRTFVKGKVKIYFDYINMYPIIYKGWKKGTLLNGVCPSFSSMHYNTKVTPNDVFNLSNIVGYI